MRLRGHSLTHIVLAPERGWIWECECRHNAWAYSPTKAMAQAEHRDHKARVASNTQHEGVVIYRTREGLRARCYCGLDLGLSQTLEATDAAHRAHAVDVENTKENT